MILAIMINSVKISEFFLLSLGLYKKNLLKKKIINIRT